MTQAINSTQALYRCLPAMDSLLLIPQVISFIEQQGKPWIKSLLAQMLKDARQQIAKSQSLPSWCLDSSQIAEELACRIVSAQRQSMTPVINLTGTILHTNLGRSQMCEAAINAVTQVMRSPVPLEFDMGQGKRGHRDSAISALIHELTGADSCCIVNNNAAAVLLMLAAISAGKEVIVSRGELVEIGGAFRIPDIMAQAGCKLVEVGCTNRTHLKDYAAAINDNTAAIMKVHTSNYHISGFTKVTEELELAALCKEQGIALISDLGSGALTDLSRFGLSKEPMPQQMLSDGVNLVSFSGDKLLGGPQAGLVVGDAELIAKLQAHPLKRALRCDKMTLAALEATLMQYRNPQALHSLLPIFRKLSRPLAELKALSLQLRASCSIQQTQFDITIKPCQTQVGSGSQPDVLLDSVALCFSSKVNSQLSVLQLDKFFKAVNLPIIGRITANQLWLDLRGTDNDAQLIEALTTSLIDFEQAHINTLATSASVEVTL
ncbi:L-seryl-tRNA(Sec) selenium transferase [Shewanella schlegeliana]|uniref:L-seryl-tRNA(Sec) selenium transferase n=1 Tax=Shewanella schlegeliana TaxID=190308 RepID=A0ABS1T5Q6_9GAMM|nr:L-seryl-tRNA(Sec) selenium transferase [Shewanella schlegeliana]MBL4914826.1 L-seryl-tRNA(Sec) selenium transferase [Shewanella schlegeliana]MCL1110483.1 L-seryl-tRNA(Sec) selenium transferase [Shewanella schlegeliana]GIU27465.1 L-seryl-tRNA(Sec) selenium transferase [Shewanella schlegeliana]